MCGIVGLFAKNNNLNKTLGLHLSNMLEVMSDRGPDSAGVAIYRDSKSEKIKVTLQSKCPVKEFKKLKEWLAQEKIYSASLFVNSSHAILECTEVKKNELLKEITNRFKEIKIISNGRKMEIYKEVGQPKSVIDRFKIRSIAGSHGIGHTRMATESAVTTLGAHPFSTGMDQCLVHNGSLSNHNSLRRTLIRDNMIFETENDSEVAASYITNKMNKGADLRQSLECSLKDFDGFYTLVVGTINGFGVLRDPIACKPAVLAETEDYVAFGSEYRALSPLPNIDKAQVWEPEPATVYFWEHN